MSRRHSRSVVRGLSLLLLAPVFISGSIAAPNAKPNTKEVAGSVHNQTAGHTAVGDEVVLLCLDATTQEEARVTTDSQGRFLFAVQHPDKPYLLRALHQGVAYDRKVAAGDTLVIDVFDAAPQVSGVTGTLEILRTGTNGKLLHVSDMYEIKNDSNPPLTQIGERTFEVFLPSGAKIDSVLAAGPEGIGQTISALPMPGEPGHYLVNFPLRPGATKFAFNYDVPYTGHAAFRTRLAYPMQLLAVMIPPTMKFASRSAAFEPLSTGNARYQVRAAKRLAAGAGPAFEISGAGALPSLVDPRKFSARDLPQIVAALPLPAVSIPPPPIPVAPTNLQRGRAPSQSLVLTAIASLLAVTCIFLVWRSRRPSPLPRAKPF